MTQKTEKKQEKNKNLVGTRGRIFEGVVKKKFPTRIVIEFEKTAYVKKYESYYKKKTRLHARLPKEIDANVGDFIRVQECRPLSKIIHFIAIEKILKEKK